MRRPLVGVVVLASIALVAVPSGARAATREVVDEVHYTLTGSDSVAFDWRGAATDIRYGPTASYGAVATGAQPDPLPWSSNGPFREARLSGLTPGTTYHYSIGGGPDHTFQTTPAGPFRFDMEADVGSSDDIAMAMTQTDIAADDPAFVLVPGDLTYADQKSTVDKGKATVDRHFNDVMSWSRGAAYLPMWGNHEWEDPPGPNDDLRNYKGRFALPNAQASTGAPALGCCGEDWYWFDAGGVRFIAYPEPYSGAWAEWRTTADPVFAAAQADPNIRFIVTFGHRPAYSTGYHPATDNSTNSMGTILNGFGEKYTKYVLNLNGHSHNYERFQPIHGVTHITSGGGGAEEEVPWGAVDARTRVRAFHLEHLRIDVGAGGMHIQAVCGPATVDDDTVCPRGSVLDEYTIAAPRAKPEVYVTSPDDHALVSTATPAVTGTAGTLGQGDAATVSVELYSGDAATGTPVQTLAATVQKNGTWSAPAALAPGTYTVVARQESTNGAGASAPRTFDVGAADGVAPTSSAGDVTQSAAGLSIPFTAADSGGSGLASVKLYVKPPGATSYSLAGTSTQAGGTFTYSPATSGLGNGTYSLYTVAADRAGNVEAAPAAADADVAVTTTAAAVPKLSSPLSGYSTTDQVHFEGTADPSSQITLFDNSSTVVTSVPVRGDGSWSADVTNVTDGSHRYTAKATSPALNTSSSSAAATVVVDTHAPSSDADAPAYTTAASVTVTYTAADDTGGSGTATVELWVRPPGAVGYTKVDSAAAASGSFAYLLGAGEGRYDFYTVAVDKAGNREAPPAAPTASTTYDATPPAVAVTAPAAGSFTNNPSPTLAGVGGTAPGDNPAITVQLDGATGGQTLNAIAAAGSGAWSVGVQQPLADGTYTVVATQTDAAGNTGSSAPHSFTVDTKAPLVSLAHPFDAELTRDPTPSFDGSAGIAAGDAATVTVAVYRGTGTGDPPVQTLTATRDAVTGAWAVEPASALPDGTYTVQVAQDDSAGNTGTSQTATFTVDTTAPQPTLTRPTDGSATQDATPTLAGTAGTAARDQGTVTVTIRDAGGVVQTRTATVAGDGSWTVDATSLRDGTYTAQATQDDSARNTGTSATVTFTVDTTAPQPTLTRPTDGSATQDATPTLAGTAGTAARDQGTVTVTIRDAGGVVQTRTAPVAADGTWTVDATSLRDGTYTAEATQDDSAGNAGTSQTATFTVDTTAPEPTLTRPTDGSATQDTTPTLAGTAGIASGDEHTVAVKVYAGADTQGTLAQTREAPVGADGSWTVDATQLGEGRYTVQAEQRDAAGNVGKSATVTFTVDVTAAAPSVSSPDDGSFTNQRTPTISGTAEGPSAVTVEVYAGPDTSGTPLRSLTANPDAGGAWSVVVTPALADGTYTVQAKQTDAADNVGTSDPVGFTVDTVAPEPTLAHPADGSATNDPKPTFDGTAGTASGDDATVTVRIYAGSSTTGEPVATISAARTQQGRWESKPAQPLADGRLTAAPDQSDAAGNAHAGAPHTFTVDTVKPTSHATAPATAAPGPLAIAFAARDERSGVQAVELYARVPGAAAYQLAGRDASGATTGTFAYTPASGDGAYRFYTRAVDRAGNQEDAPAAPDATTTVTTVSGGDNGGGTGGTGGSGGSGSSGGGSALPLAPLACTLAGPSRPALARVAKRGLTVSVSCTAPGRWALALRVPAATARRIGLTRRKAAVTVARASGVLTAAGTARARLKPTRRAAKALRRLKRAKLTLELTATDAQGARHRSARTIVLRR